MSTQHLGEVIGARVGLHKLAVIEQPHPPSGCGQAVLDYVLQASCLSMYPESQTHWCSGGWPILLPMLPGLHSSL